MYNAQLAFSQQHSIFLCASECSVYLGVSVIVVSSQMNSLLIKRSRTCAVYIACHRQFNSLLDILECSVAALLLHFSELKCVEIHQVEVEYIDCTVFELSVLHVLHCVYSQWSVKFQQVNSHLNDFCIAYDDRLALRVCAFVRKRANTNLRTDAGRVAHSNCKYWDHVFMCFVMVIVLPLRQCAVYLAAVILCNRTRVILQQTLLQHGSLSHIVYCAGRNANLLQSLRNAACL